MDCHKHLVVKTGLIQGKGPLVNIGDFVEVVYEVELLVDENGERISRDFGNGPTLFYVGENNLTGNTAQHHRSNMLTYLLSEADGGMKKGEYSKFILPSECSQCQLASRPEQQTIMTINVKRLWQDVKVGRIEEEARLRERRLLLELLAINIHDDTAGTRRDDARIELVGQRFAAPLPPSHPTVPTAFHTGKQLQETRDVQQAQGLQGYDFSAMRKSTTPYSGGSTRLQQSNAAEQGWGVSEQLQRHPLAQPSSQSLGPFPPTRASTKPVQSQWQQPCPRGSGPQASGQTAASWGIPKRPHGEIDIQRDTSIWEFRDGRQIHRDSQKRPRNECGTHPGSNEPISPKIPRQAPHPPLSATSNNHGNPCQSRLLPPLSQVMAQYQTEPDQDGSIAHRKSFNPVNKMTRSHPVGNVVDGVRIRADGRPDKRSMRKRHQDAGYGLRKPFSEPSSALMSGFGGTSKKTEGEGKENFGKRATIGERHGNPENPLDTIGTGGYDDEWQRRLHNCEDMCQSMEKSKEIHASESMVVRKVSEPCSEQRSHKRSSVEMHPPNETSQPVASSRSSNKEEVANERVSNPADGASMARDEVPARARDCGPL